MANSKRKTKRTKADLLDILYRNRNRALERVVAVWKKGEGAADDEMNKAVDALTVAHISATFEWAS